MRLQNRYCSIGNILRQIDNVLVYLFIDSIVTRRPNIGKLSVIVL